MPGPVSFERYSGVDVSQMQLGHPWIRANAQRSNSAPLVFANGSIEAGIRLAERVVVAKRQKWMYPEAARPRASVLNDDRLFAVDEKDFLLEACAANVEGPDRERIEPKLDEVPKPGRVKRARILVGAQGDVDSLDRGRLIELGQDEEPLDGRMKRGDEQTVIAAGVGTGDGSHRKPAGAVGLQPFEMGRPIEVDASVPLDSDGCERLALLRVHRLSPSPLERSNFAEHFDCALGRGELL